MASLKIKPLLVLLIATLVVTGISACKDKFDDTKETDERRLEALMTDIKNSSEQTKCENAADWKFRAIGSKACGGPAGYIAYSVKIDTNEFIKKVDEYTSDQKEFNKKWGISSDCSLVNPPKSVMCENEKPKLVYQ